MAAAGLLQAEIVTADGAIRIANARTNSDLFWAIKGVPGPRQTAGGGPPVYPGIPGHQPDLTASRKDAVAIDKAVGELRKIVPEAGSYVSEANFFEKSWQQPLLGTELYEITVGEGEI
ncbi:MAG: hypothetical protein WBX20_11245 [Terrimicrobiaceae bacterium]